MEILAFGLFLQARYIPEESAEDETQKPADQKLLQDIRNNFQEIRALEHKLRLIEDKRTMDDQEPEAD